MTLARPGAVFVIDRLARLEQADLRQHRQRATGRSHHAADLRRHGGRATRLVAAFGLAATLLLPAAGHAAAATQVLRVGTTQDLDSLNPFQTAYLVGYEIFTLNYDMLVGFGPNNETVAGYAETWTQSTDGLQWTFKIHSGMTWSDGQAATAEDAVDAIAAAAPTWSQAFLKSRRR